MKVGIDLGGSHIAIGIVDRNGNILEKTEKRITSIEKKHIKNTIENYIVQNIEKFSKKYKINEIGIAIPGSIDNKKIIKSVNLSLENYNIVESLQKYIDIPIKIRNDAKCAALAENKYGSMKNYNRNLFLTLGTGIGGAVIINGELLNTGNFAGCEFGHMTIYKNGILCNCGKKGCFEKYASMKSFKNNLRKELGLDETTSGKMLLDMIRENNNKEESLKDKRIEKIVEQFIEDLSIGIANLVNIFEPEAIGIGGSFVYFEDVLLEKLKNKIISNNLLFNARDNIIIKPAILRNDAGIIGAIL